jgi:multiple sugar transport system permease protein
MRIIPRPTPKKPRRRSKLYHPITPYLFVLPYLLFFIVLRFGPSIAGLGMSFTEWTIVGSPKFVGLANFRDMLSDQRFLTALKNTVFFVAVTVPVLVVVSLLIAVFLNQARKGQGLGRVAVFTPYVLMSTVVGVIWTWLLEKDFGLINVYLGKLGIRGPPWLVDPDCAMFGIIITTVWWTVGFNTVLFLAGLQDIPEEYYEAARIDGANKLQEFFSITVPLLAPTMFMVILLSIINSFQVFDQVYVMTSGGPGMATLTLVQYIYTAAFQFRKMGYGAAVASVLFAILVTFALLQIRLFRRGVRGVDG